jgi:hypothetical protein
MELVLILVVILVGLGVLAYAIKRGRSFIFRSKDIEVEMSPIRPKVVKVASVINLETTPEPVRPGAREEWEKAAQANHERLFGVDEEVQTTADLVRLGPNGTITSLHGEGGLGKTAIAYEAVLAARDSYDVVAWVSARSITEDEGTIASRVGFKDVLYRMCDQLKVSAPSPARAPDLFVRTVYKLAEKNKKNLLLIVDNLESAADLAEIVDLVTAKRIVDLAHVVITTRTQVKFTGRQQHVRVHERTLAGLSIEDSCAFIRHLGQVSPAIAAADDARLAPIPRVVDGNPYLIKITTRQLCQRALPIDRLLAEIRKLDEAKARKGQSLASEIRDYMFAAALEQLDNEVGPDARSAVLAAFCVEPPGSRLPYDLLLTYSKLPDSKFANALEFAAELSLVHKHDINDLFSIHSLLHAYSSSHGQ